MSDSVRPRPWESPGKNTGVGCHFLLQCMNVKTESEVSQSCLTLHDPMDCSPPGSSIHGVFQARVLDWGAIAFSIISALQMPIFTSIFAFFYSMARLLTTPSLPPRPVWFQWSIFSTLFCFFTCVFFNFFP